MEPLKQKNAMHLMDKPIEQQLALPISTKQQWLESVALATDQKGCHDFGNYLQQQRFMRVMGNPLAKGGKKTEKKKRETLIYQHFHYQAAEAANLT